MTWHGWLVLLCIFLLDVWNHSRRIKWQQAARSLAFRLTGVEDERDKALAERDQARSDLDFTTEVLSDVAADRAQLQDQVLSLQTRIRVHDLRRWGADRFGLN